MITEKDPTQLDIASRVIIHDIHQVEIKLEYNLEELLKTNNYKIETFFFIPTSLQINEDTYPREDFYSDLQTYIRFKTPVYSFKMILDPDFVKSPIYELKKILYEFKTAKTHNEKIDLARRCQKELKLLGVMVRARLRDFLTLVKRSLPKTSSNCQPLLKKVKEKISLGIKVLEQLREIKRQFKNNFPEEKETLKYFSLVEEFVSHLLEEDFIGILKILQKGCDEKDPVNEITRNFTDFCKKEKKYRREKNFYLIFKNEEWAKEQYIYHRSQYKKTIASVLYLDIVREKKKAAYIHMVGSGAAFTAALVYFAITYFISKSFAINSLPFVLMISMGYVFKDRIKEFIKIVLNPRVLSRFPDHTTKIKDISEEGSTQLGEIREKVFFAERDSIDPRVLEMRDRTRPWEYLPEESPEELMIYQKEININTASIRERHSRTVNITDIMRFSIQKFLAKMDDPEQYINYYDEEKDEIATTTGGRTYHINLVIKYSKFRNKTEISRYERYRLVANKWGMLRVEFVK